MTLREEEKNIIYRRMAKFRYRHIRLIDSVNDFRMPLTLFFAFLTKTRSCHTVNQYSYPSNSSFYELYRSLSN